MTRRQQVFRFPDRVNSLTGTIGAIDDGFRQLGFGTDDLQAAWDAGYRKIRGRAGATYELSEQLEATDEDVSLDLEHCTLVQAGDERLFYIKGTFSDEQTVTASTTTTTTVTNGAAFDLGDVIKKASFGVLNPYVQDQAGEKGDSLVVSAIAGNVLTHGSSIFDYTTGADTNVRVAKFSTARVWIRIGEVTDSDMAAEGQSVIRLEGLTDVDVEISRVTATYSSVFDTHSLYGGRLHIGSLIYVKSAASQRYGFSEHGSQQVEFSGGNARQIRHFFTATGAGSGTPGEFANAGTSSGNTIADMLCDGSNVACFDSHHGPYLNRFTDLRAKPNPNGHCYTSRGIANEFVDCEGEGGGYGLNCIIQTGYTAALSPTDDTLLLDATFINQTSSWVIGADVGVGSIYVTGGFFVVDDGANRAIMMNFYNTISIITGARMIFRAPCVGTNSLIRAQASCEQVELTDCIIDIVGSDWSSSPDRGLIVAAPITKIIVMDVVVKNDSNDALPSFLAGLFDRTHSKLGNIIIDYLDVGFFRAGQYEWWQIETAEMLVGPIRVLSGPGALDIEPRRKDYTRYLDGNVGLQIHAATSQLMTGTLAVEFSDTDWFIDKSGGADVTFSIVSSPSIPPDTGIPFAMKAVSVDAHSIGCTKQLSVAEARALLGDTVTVCWVSAPAGLTITIGYIKPAAPDDFTTVATLDSMTYTATGDWQEISFHRDFVAANVENGMGVTVAVTATAAAQTFYFAGFATAQGIVPPLFDLAPLAYDTMMVA